MHSCLRHQNLNRFRNAWSELVSASSKRFESCAEQTPPRPSPSTTRHAVARPTFSISVRELPATLSLRRCFRRLSAPWQISASATMLRFRSSTSKWWVPYDTCIDQSCANILAIDRRARRVRALGEARARSGVTRGRLEQEFESRCHRLHPRCLR
jgi:hypothetical protein